MSGLFPPDYSGVIWTLVSLIALVFVGVVLTMVTDSNLRSGSDAFSGHDVATSELASLQAQVSELERRREQFENWDSDAVKLRVTNKQLKAIAQERARLISETQELRDELGQLTASFDRYRSDYRARIWAESIGREFALLETRSGKQYYEATIRSVSEDEVTISHKVGIAGIPVFDLPSEIADELQLDSVRPSRDSSPQVATVAGEDLSEGEGLSKQYEGRGGKSAQPSEQPRGDGGKRDEEDPDREEILALRLEVAKLEVQVERLQDLFDEAQLQSRGNQRSPPGSLETWEQRAARLATLERKASVRLRVAEDRLMELDPQYRRRR